MVAEGLERVALPEPLRLSSGARLEKACLAFRSWGERRSDNTLVLLHGLSRSPAAQQDGAAPGRSTGGWANALFGAGRPFDPGRYHVVCPNLLGSPFGSTSAASPEWRDRPFPELSVTDQADAVAAFLQAQGHEKVRAVVGFSLGGTVALALAARHPGLVRAVATLGGPALLPAAARRRLGLVATMLLADPEYRGDGQGPGAARALRRVRVALLRDLYPRDYSLMRGGAFESERLLDAEAEQFTREFDARCYLTLCRAMASADLTGDLAAVKARCLVAACSTDPLATSTAMQDTYHSLTAAGVRTRYFEIAADGGHHAFYKEPESLAFPLHDLISD
ncbi:MAG TPA: alpha/beta fold hydrolase [Myxococcales bacterium]|jgi:homoserine O-acetyltransferase